MSVGPGPGLDRWGSVRNRMNRSFSLSLRFHLSRMGVSILPLRAGEITRLGPGCTRLIKTALPPTPANPCALAAVPGSPFSLLPPGLGLPQAPCSTCWSRDLTFLRREACAAHPVQPPSSSVLTGSPAGPVSCCPAQPLHLAPFRNTPNSHPSAVPPITRSCDHSPWPPVS